MQPGFRLGGGAQSGQPRRLSYPFGLGFRGTSRDGPFGLFTQQMLDHHLIQRLVIAICDQ
jgi:hypothetical protein